MTAHGPDVVQCGVTGCDWTGPLRETWEHLAQHRRPPKQKPDAKPTFDYSRDLIVPEKGTET